MRKKAIFLDLDNTIYPVSSIGEKLFKTLYQLIIESGEYNGKFDEVKAQILRKPYQLVSKEFSFSARLHNDGLTLLTNLVYSDPIKPFDGYKLVKEFPCKKFLITFGFTKMQHSKIDMLGIRNDFEEIFVIDPDKTHMTQKDIFLRILKKHNLETSDVVVVGDDLNSEIKAASELGIDTILYDFNAEHAKIQNQIIVTDLKQLENLVSCGIE
jgi:putative hydrolase of the HAD superfamily